MLKSEAVTDAGLVAAANEKLDRMEVAEGARLKAPETASPKGKFETHSQAMEQFLATRKKIENLMLQEDMSLMAAGFVHPKLGAMTREQWVRFLIWHTKHHQQQIGRILQATG